MIKATKEYDGNITLEVKPEECIEYFECISTDGIGATFIIGIVLNGEHVDSIKIFDIINNKWDDRELTIVDVVMIKMSHQVRLITEPFTITLPTRTKLLSELN